MLDYQIIYLQANRPEINDVTKATTKPLICETSSLISEEVNNVNSKKVIPNN